MKLFSWILLFCVLTANSQVIESSNDSLEINKPKKTFLKQITVPRVLIGTSLLISGTTLEKGIQNDIGNLVGNDFTTKMDDYMWYVPLVEMYSADLLGVEAKNHWFDQSKNAFVAHTINKYTTNALKGLIHKTRPNGYNDNSFPSGHTSKAFTSATILYEEFKDTNPWLAYSGYAFASTTGFLRVAKNSHYLSDVLAGAGLGILITKLVYHFDYLFDWNPFKKNQESESLTKFNVAPSIYNDTVGLTAVIQF
ncbi:phosphatase PAP2 family protein [Psychroserpens sp. XS_ASV72]|uniref:phosphatase PAP2 family protein n=1 Tax=Psychroserpens sp. XS_ASV72 TaxID=3241293 RepID=UPI003515B21A